MLDFQRPENNFTYDDWEKYERMFKKMDNIKSFIIASQIAGLGFPRFTNSIPTAAVALDPRTNDILFLFNREFFRKLSVDDLAFVFVHEVLHVAFQHIQRSIKLGIDPQKDPAKFKLWNIAIDCIVNVWATELGFGPTDKIGIQPVFPETIGYPNFTGSTTSEQIYSWLLTQNKDALEKIEQMQTMDSHEGWSETGQNPKMDDFAEGVAGALKEEFFKSGQKSLEKKAAEDLKKKGEQARNKKDSSGGNVFVKHASQVAGTGAVGEPRHYQNLKDRVSPDVLRKIHRRIKSEIDTRPKETWARPPRKLMDIWPSILLPYEHELDDKCKYKALLVLDSSGSITDDMISQAVRYGRSFPLDKIDYTPISFDDAYYELNKKDFYDRNRYPTIPGRGGTDISMPERYINEVYLKKYKCRPDLVLIITDGYGSHPYAINPKHQDSYVWIMTKNHDEKTVKNYCPGGMIFKTNIS